MPVYEFTAPDGKTYEVEGPGNAQDAFAILQGQLGGRGAAASLAEPAEEGFLGRAHREGATALGSAWDDTKKLFSSEGRNAEDYRGPGGALRSLGETGKALLSGISVPAAYPIAAATSLGASALGPALRGTEGLISSGVEQFSPEKAAELRARIPSEEQAYEAVKPGVGAALSAFARRAPGATAVEQQATAVENLLRRSRNLDPDTPPPPAEPAPPAPVGSRAADVQAAERLGVQVPSYLASDNVITRMMGMGLSNTPIIGRPLVNANEKFLADLGGAVKGVTEAQGGRSAEVAGDVAKRGLMDWLETGSKEPVREAYDAVTAAIDPNFRQIPKRTQEVAEAIRAERKNAARRGESAAVREVEGAIADPQDEIFAQLAAKLGPEAARKLAPRIGQEGMGPSGLNYEGIKNLRTAIREKIDDKLTPKVEKTELQRIHGALTEDLNDIVKRAGNTTASALFERANTLARETAKQRDHLLDLVGLKGDANPAQVMERIKAAATGKSRADTELLGRVRKLLGDDWDEVVSGITGNLGIGKTTQQFETGQFMRDYGALSDAGKSMLYGTGAHRQALDDVAALSARWNKTHRFQNFSGTARTAAIVGTALDPLAAMAKVFDPSVAAGLATAGYAAHRLARPITVQEVLGKPASAASAAAWTRAYERAARLPSPAAAAQLTIQTRNLLNTVAPEK